MCHPVRSMHYPPMPSVAGMGTIIFQIAIKQFSRVLRHSKIFRVAGFQSTCCIRSSKNAALKPQLREATAAPSPLAPEVESLQQFKWELYKTDAKGEPVEQRRSINEGSWWLLPVTRQCRVSNERVTSLPSHT